MTAQSPTARFVTDTHRPGLFSGMVLAGILLLCQAGNANAQDHSATAQKAPAAEKPAAVGAGARTNPVAKAVGEQVRDALDAGIDPNKRVTLTVEAKKARAEPSAQAALQPIAAAPGAIPNPAASRQHLRAKAAAMAAASGTAGAAAGTHGAGEVHWSYDGEGGPAAWGRLKPEFNVCAIGKRQSPINIEEPATLRGPAEPILFDYAPSTASVVNNGHTIQVDVSGDNAITVRGSTYRLLQFHFHHPSEERVNFRSFAMVAHLVHRNPEGQLAVVAVLLDPGEANALINKVWTYMPLDSGDRVRMPAGMLNMNELLPRDQRYYQFMGSLTTPPCTEGVLWMVLKQPVAVSREQLRLFGQLFPNNARPVQPVNGRAIRDAQ